MSKPRNRRKPTLEGILIPLNDVPDMLSELSAEEVKKIILSCISYGKELNSNIEAEPERQELSSFGRIAYNMIARHNAEYAYHRKAYNDGRSGNRNGESKSEQGESDPDPDPESKPEEQHMTTYVDTCGHMTTHDNTCQIPILSYPSKTILPSSSSSIVTPEEQERMTETDDDDGHDESFIRIRNHAQSKRTPEAKLTIEYYNEHLKSYDPDQVIRAIDRAAAQGKKIESWGYIVTALKNPETKQKQPMNAQNYNQRNYDKDYYSSIEEQAIRDLLKGDV